jgi:pyruvate, water dikinase
MERQLLPTPLTSLAAETIVQQDIDRPNVVWFDQVQLADVSTVGGKNASLGEMIQNLSNQGVTVPNGFAITASAYTQFVRASGLDQKLRSIFADVDAQDVNELTQRSHFAQSLILEASFPTQLEQDIRQGYRQLCEQYGHAVDVAVRSSATAEDLPDASFAGQQDTFLNIRGEVALLEACKNCFASLFTARAVSYRQAKGFDHFAVALSIGVQKMVRSDLACSGVMFSIDPETGFRNAVLISAAYGLGETIVQGAVNPDEYLVFKPALREGFHPILRKRLGSKQLKLVYDDSRKNDSRKSLKTESVPLQDRHQFALNEEDIVQLAHWACVIEEHYSQQQGRYTPMDIEWAKDGITGDLYIVQARPETVQSQKPQTVLQHYQLNTRSDILVAAWERRLGVAPCE